MYIKNTFRKRRIYRIKIVRYLIYDKHKIVFNSIYEYLLPGMQCSFNARQCTFIYYKQNRKLHIEGGGLVRVVRLKKNARKILKNEDAGLLRIVRCPLKSKAKSVILEPFGVVFLFSTYFNV